MLNKSFVFVASVVILSMGEISWAGIVQLGPETGRFEVTSSLEVLVDPTGVLNIEDIQRSNQFQALEESTVNLGITPDACWVRAKLLNLSEKSDWILEVSYPPLDLIDFYYETLDGKIAHNRSGDRVPFEQRFVAFRNSNFQINLPKDKVVTIWLRVQTSSALQVPVNLYTSVEFAERIASESFGFGLYYGLLFMVLAFNVVLALITRETIFIGYIGYLINYLIFQLSLNGFLFQYLLGTTPGIANALLLTSFFLAVVGAMTFTRIFLELDRTLKLADSALKWASYTCMVGALASLFLDYGSLIAVAAPVGVAFPILVLIAGIQVWRQGHSHARLFVLAWALFLLGCVLFGLRALGLLPANAFTLYAIQVGSTLEVLLLTVAVGNRITRLRAERDLANDALTDSYALLDVETARRNRLREEVESLQEEVARTSDQLAAADKLATLGTVMAGIAHDIANPSSLILTRSIQLTKLASDTQGFLDTLLGEASDPESEEVQKEFAALFDRSRQLAREVELAALQINAINSAIRNQVREDLWESGVSLNEIIDECLVILSVSFGDIQIQRAGPQDVLFTCSRSRIGQVAMNLLKNAADAIYSKGSPGKILVTTDYEDKDIVFRVEDNGPGFEEGMQSKIFDVFYTTKEVGKGTGLGLAIVSRIVEEHGGSISAGRSEALSGASFLIRLPREQANGRSSS